MIFWNEADSDLSKSRQKDEWRKKKQEKLKEEDLQ